MSSDGKAEQVLAEEMEARREGFFCLLDLAYALDDAGRTPVSFADMILLLFPSKTHQQWAREWGVQRFKEQWTG